MALTDNIIRELRTYFLSLDRKNVMSADLKPEVDDTLRLGSPDKKFHAIYVNRIIADDYGGPIGGGGTGTIGNADTVGIDFLTATETEVIGNLYPLQDDGFGNPIFPATILPGDIAYQYTVPTFTSINVTNYVDGVAIGAHDHSGSAHMGSRVDHANLLNLSADHHTIYTRWDDTETIIKKWKFANLADTNQGFNEYVGWEIESTVVLAESGGVYYPNVNTAQAVLQTLSYVDPDGIATISIDSGGTGYIINDILTVSAGNQDATINVDTVSGGIVTSVSIIFPGSGYSVDTAVETTGGTGSGCTIDIDEITNYTSYEHSYPLQIISHAQYAAITLGGNQEILIRTDATDTWIAVDNITLSAANGITIGSTFEVTQAGVLTATAGYIADWQILPDKLQSETGDVILDGDGYIQLSGGGDTEVRISAIHADYRFWLGSEGESNWDETTAKFIVNPAGQITAETVAIKGLLHNYGSDKWRITSDGNAEFENIRARGRLDTLVFTKSSVSSIAGVLSLSNGSVLADTVHAAGAIDEISISNGGIGYSEGDSFSIDGGSTPAILAVTSVSSGEIITYNISAVGSGYSAGSDITTTALTGSGSGCTVDIDSIHSTDDTTIYLDAPEFGFGDIVVLQPSADSQEWMLITSIYTIETIINSDGESIEVFKYSVSRDFDETGKTYSFKPGVAVNGRGSYSIGNDPLPVASGEIQGVFGDYQPSGTFTGAGGGWINLDGENAHITVNVRTGPLPAQYQSFIRIGNLQGILNYGTIEWGFAIGDENNYLTYDQTDGLIIYSRSGDTKINSTGITSDAFIISLETVEPASAPTDTVIIYYYNDLIRYRMDDSGDETTGILMTEVADDTSPQLGGELHGGGYAIDNVDRYYTRQSAHAAGNAIFGYDTMSAKYLGMSVGSVGESTIAATDHLILASGNSQYIHIHSDLSVYMDLGDTAGATYFYLRDSSSTPVHSINSNGDVDLVQGDLANIKQADFYSVYDNSTSGTSKTINWNNGNKQKLQITGNACDLSYTNPAGPCALELRLIGNGTLYTNVDADHDSDCKWADNGEPDAYGSTSGQVIGVLFYSYDPNSTPKYVVSGLSRGAA